MTMALNYESFVRTAFGFGTTGSMLERWGDPAGLANTDCFNAKDIAAVKAATAYAMEIMSYAVIEGLEGELSDAEKDQLKEFTRQVIQAPDLKAIDGLISRFNDAVVERRFQFDHGRVALK